MTETLDVASTDRAAAAVPSMGSLVPRELHYEIEQFLYFEARLLDERRYREWWQLLSDDIHYWMPARSNRSAREQHLENTGPGEIAHFDENKLSLEWRVRRIETGMAWTEDPPSRTRHLVSNVHVTPRDEPDEYDVQSNFMIYRNRLERQSDTWVGTRRDVLVRIAPLQWQIRRRTILLDQNVVLSNNLGVFF